MPRRDCAVEPLGAHMLFCLRIALFAVLSTYSSCRAVADVLLLADPANMLQTAVRKDFLGANRLSVENAPFGLCLRSTPERSATALYQQVAIPADMLERVSWKWKVEKLQNSADIRNLRHEDFGAKIMFVFGEPSLFNKDVPTLAYVWTGTPVPNGAVLQSQRYHSLFYIQLRGAKNIGQWQQEQVNVVSDFLRVFGHAPGPLKYIALFNDNDQTNETTSALFGPITGLH